MGRRGRRRDVPSGPSPDAYSCGSLAPANSPWEDRNGLTSSQGRWFNREDSNSRRRCTFGRCQGTTARLASGELLRVESSHLALVLFGIDPLRGCGTGPTVVLTTIDHPALSGWTQQFKEWFEAPLLKAVYEEKKSLFSKTFTEFCEREPKPWG